jgi:hypothetical protein
MDDDEGAPRFSPDMKTGREPLLGNAANDLEKGEPEGAVPPSPLWAMKFKRHIQWHLLPEHDRHDQIRDRIGSGDDAVYVIDDGRHHVMLGRRVGVSFDGCEYALLGRAPRERYEELKEHRMPEADAFTDADELALCGEINAEDPKTATVIDIAGYERLEDVPEDFLPGKPYIHFTEDLEITAY